MLVFFLYAPAMLFRGSTCHVAFVVQFISQLKRFCSGNIHVSLDCRHDVGTGNTIGRKKKPELRRGLMTSPTHTECAAETGKA